jgi:hypothetical protein
MLLASLSSGDNNPRVRIRLLAALMHVPEAVA